MGIATEAVNNTLNVFVDETNKVLDTAFGKTPLRDPIQEVLNCLILLKVQGIQKAMTWVHDNAHINFPTLPNDTFSVGALASLSGDSQAGQPDQSFLAEPNDKASDKITEAVRRVITFLEDGIRTEAIIASLILAVYVFVCLSGVGAAFYRARFNKFKTNRGDGGAVLRHFIATVPAARENFRSDDQDRYVHGDNNPVQTVVDNNINNKKQPHHQHDPVPEYSEKSSPVSRISSEHDDYQDSKQSADRNPFADSNGSPGRHEKSGGFI